MGLKEVLEEIEVLRSIFCQCGEFALHSDIDSIKCDSTFSITYSINIEVEKGQLLPSCKQADEFPKDFHAEDAMIIVLTLTVNEKYPSKLEGVSLGATGLTNRNVNELKDALDKYITEHLLNKDEDPIVMKIVEWVQDTAKNSSLQCKNRTPCKEKKDETMHKCVVFTLDHMRSKQKYTKLITGWMGELDLIGRVIFFKKMIWVLIYGINDDVREYIKRHKTCNVDVDSNGRPCKERMMNILIDIDSILCSKVLDRVKVVECSVWKEVADEFSCFDINPEELRK